ncbi:unnamed protein product, partial [Ectocarpus fasciculatus]
SKRRAHTLETDSFPMASWWRSLSYSADLNLRRAHSGSTTIASATLCTRPALSPGGTKFQMTGIR